MTTTTLNANEWLMGAVKNDDADGVLAAIKAGADIDARCGWGAPLAMAVNMPRLEMVRLLLSLDADIDVRDDLGLTPLGRALRVRSYELALDLLDAGADVNLPQGASQETPLAQVTGRPGSDIGLTVVMCLLQKGADPNQADAEGVTPFHKALRHEDPRYHAIRAMLKAGAIVDAAAVNDASPQALKIVRDYQERILVRALQKARNNEIRTLEKDVTQVAKGTTRPLRVRKLFGPGM